MKLVEKSFVNENAPGAPDPDPLPIRTVPEVRVTPETVFALAAITACPLVRP